MTGGSISRHFKERAMPTELQTFQESGTSSNEMRKLLNALNAVRAVGVGHGRTFGCGPSPPLTKVNETIRLLSLDTPRENGSPRRRPRMQALTDQQILKEEAHVR